MTKQELEQQLNDLRNKWKGDYPKNYLDRRWWRFNTDKLLAEQIKTQLKKIDAGQEITVSDLNQDQIENIFK
jgi:hypothetical protein